MFILGPPGRQPLPYVVAGGNPDLGLHAASITYNEQIDGTHWDVTINYDFADAGQLDDWVAMSNTTLAVSGGFGTCTINGTPANNIIGMRTAFNIVPARVDYVVRNTTAGFRTFNVYRNVTTWTGGNYVPPTPADGIVCLSDNMGRLWVADGAEGSNDNNGTVAQNTWYTCWITFTTSAMQQNWGSPGPGTILTDTVTRPNNDAHILVGGYQSNTEWDSISIRGIIATS
jgi:hypothetical protein